MKKADKFLNTHKKFNLSESLDLSQPDKSIAHLKPNIDQIYTYLNSENKLIVKAVDNLGVWVQSLNVKGIEGQGFWTFNDWSEDFKSEKLKFFEGTYIKEDWLYNIDIISIKPKFKVNELIKKD